MKHYILVFLIIFSSLSYSHEIKTVIVELNGMDFVNDDLTYGNQILWIPEIDEEVVASGSVQGFLARYKKVIFLTLKKVVSQQNKDGAIYQI